MKLKSKSKSKSEFKSEFKNAQMTTAAAEEMEKRGINVQSFMAQLMTTFCKELEPCDLIDNGGFVAIGDDPDALNLEYIIKYGVLLVRLKGESDQIDFNWQQAMNSGRI